MGKKSRALGYRPVSSLVNKKEAKGVIYRSKSKL